MRDVPIAGVMGDAEQIMKLGAVPILFGMYIAFYEVICLIKATKDRRRQLKGAHLWSKTNDGGLLEMVVL